MALSLFECGSRLNAESPPKTNGRQDWRPFQPVVQPAVPKVKNSRWVRNSIDAFITAEHQARGLRPRPEASREVLLRRVYLDLIGLTPTPAEQQAFAGDRSSDAYERVVDRLLNDPRYGERWGRHWMDVWRYSDWAGWTDGGQVRDSKPHIWRWRDWIVESLNNDKSYAQMLVEMLAADECAPADTNALRATGFLVRNFKMLSREQWLEDTVKHTAQAFFGLTLACAKCHDHAYDPISQDEYYQFRAIFEPHQIRTDRVPGQLDTAKDGLVRVFDTDTNALTYFFIRGDERKPDTNRVMQPGLPHVLGGKFNVNTVALSRLAAQPDKREFVIQDSLAAADAKVRAAQEAFTKAKETSGTSAAKLRELELNLEIAGARGKELQAVLLAEKLEDMGQKDSSDWQRAATEAVMAQRATTVLDAQLKVHLARLAQTESETKFEEANKKLTEAKKEAEEKPDATKLSDAVKSRSEAVEKAAKALEEARKKFDDSEKLLADAEKELHAAPGTTYKPRPMENYPKVSTGRRLAFAKWLVQRENPLTARVAVNHIWLRHFGTGLVPTPADFGRNGRKPSHPALLDWLSADFMEHGWEMKRLHRMIVTSATYRMASTPDAGNARIDADNIYLWRMPSRRMEAEVVRDNLLYTVGNLDAAMGGPEIDHKAGLTSKRRSLYLRIAAEKEVEFLKIFDGPSVTECYERKPSVMPHQALALSNSELTLAQSRLLAAQISESTGQNDEQFVRVAFRRILARVPTRQEMRACLEFLGGRDLRSRGVETAPLANSAAPQPSLHRTHENFILVLFNHTDFVTIR